jgi:hypothetical protein
MKGLRQALGLFLTILAVLIVALVAEEIQPLKDLEGYLATHPGTVRWLSLSTMGLAVVGGLLLVGTQFVVRVGDEKPLDQAEVEAQNRPARGLSRRGVYRFWGRSVGSGFSDQASFHDLKDAWRQGTWRTTPRWQRFFLMILGGLCLTFGLLAYFVVIGSPGIKLLAMGALLYAAVRLAWAFWRA